MDRLKAKRLQIYLAAFFLDAVGHGFPVLVSFHAKSACQADSRELGFLGVVWMVAYSLTCFTTGGWSDRWGSMPLIWGSLSVMAFLLFPATLLATSLWHFYLAMACLGFVLALFWPPLQRQLSLFSPGRALWPALGAFNIAWAAGSVLGTLEGGPGVYESHGLSGTLGVVIGLTVLALLSTLGLSRKRIPTQTGAIEVVEHVEEGRARLFLKLAWAANFSASIAMGGLHIVFAEVAARAHITPEWSSAILISKEAGRFLSFVCLRRYAGWHYSIRWLLSLQVLAGAALLLGGFVESPVVLCGLFGVLGLFAGLSYYSSLLYSLNLRSEEGKKSALHEGILAVGVMVGPFLLGETGQGLPEWSGGPIFVAGAALWVGVVAEAVIYNRGCKAIAGKIASELPCDET